MAAENMRLWAIKGAEQRLVELAEEAKAIFATFPELRARGRGFDTERKGESGGDPRASKTPRRRRKMSREARKRIGDAQRKRWAEKRAKASPAATQPAASFAKTASGAAIRRKGAKKRISRKKPTPR